jgi:hypothetical protein
MAINTRQPNFPLPSQSVYIGNQQAPAQPQDPSTIDAKGRQTESKQLTGIPMPKPMESVANMNNGQRVVASPEDEAKRKLSDRLQQRVAAKQYLLATMGIDWTPDEDDLRREEEELPKDTEDIVRWSQPEVKEKEKRSNGLSIDFEPFMADEDEPDYVRVATSGPSTQETQEKVGPY